MHALQTYVAVCGGTTKNQITRRQKLINFGARMVTGVRRRERIGPALASPGWSRVGRLVRERDLLKVWGLSTTHRHMFVSRSAESRRATRSTESGALELQRCRLSTQRGFSHRAAAEWNRLPPAVWEQPMLPAFRRSVKACDA